MFRESARARQRRVVAFAAVRWTGVWWRECARLARVYERLADDDPPDHPVKPPCTLKNWWSTAPPHTIPTPVKTGEPRAGPKAVRRCYARGGDG